MHKRLAKVQQIFYSASKKTIFNLLFFFPPYFFIIFAIYKIPISSIRFIRPIIKWKKKKNSQPVCRRMHSEN